MQTPAASKSTPDPHPRGKRKLLLVYIHGFMGNETSFQSFPAHLHNLLSVTLEDLGWGVHTKVYPKFKTRHNISVATDGFSKWLAQFENPGTDVVLLGHSMGGILAAEVVLLRNERGGFRHRILGVVTFDSPFLGMHPGVISAGLGSLFRSEGKSAQEGGGSAEGEGVYAGANSSTASLSTAHSGSSVDEFFDMRPQRNFTIVQSKQEGTWDSALKFINKHHSHLTSATGQYLMSHLEFGGCLADPSGLRNRYNAIRKLETGEQTLDGKTIRVRFINYYTSSTGRSQDPPKPAPAAVHPERLFDLADAGVEGSGGSELQEMTREMNLGVNSPPPRAHSSNLSTSTISSAGEMAQLEADPISDNEAFCEDKPSGSTPVPIPEATAVVPEPMMPDHAPPSIPTYPTASAPAPPLISPPPPKPTEFDYSQIPDANVRKAAEKAAAKAMKLWEKSVKDYEKVVKDWEKALEKTERKKREKEKKEKRKSATQHDGEVERQRLEKERMEREERRLKGILEPPAYMGQSSIPSPSPSPSPTPSPTHCPTPMPETPQRTKRERKFCLIPRTPDARWIKVEMTGVDEVGAHCGLFFLGDVYERLVGDVAGRIEGWVGEEGTR
ncbi:hypothetical protein C7212DRAFT_203389, partial [Tuber magnatum]